MADLTQPVRPLPWFHRLSLPRHRFAVLFFFLLFSLVVFPYAESNVVGYYAFRALSSAIILLTLYAVSFRRKLIVIVICLAVPALLQRVVIAPADSSAIVLFNRILSLAFDVIVLAIIYRRIYSEQRPNTETVFGALAIYLLLGYTFASLYSLIFSLQPKAFYVDPTTSLNPVPDRFDFIFYSFGTMTELGAPGILAVSREVRSVSLLEAVLGILYLAVLISRLMSAYRASPAAEPHPLPSRQE